MEIKEYQEKSTRTLNCKLTKEQLISNMVFGANGELGEVTDILKKHLYQGHELDKKHLKEASKRRTRRCNVLFSKFSNFI